MDVWGEPSERAVRKSRHRFGWLVGAVSCAFFLVFATIGLFANIALHERGVRTSASLDRLACQHYSYKNQARTNCYATASYRAAGVVYRRTLPIGGPGALTYADGERTRIWVIYDPSDPSTVSFDAGKTGGGTTFSVVFFVCLVALLAVGLVVCVKNVFRRPVGRQARKSSLSAEPTRDEVAARSRDATEAEAWSNTGWWPHETDRPDQPVR